MNKAILIIIILSILLVSSCKKQEPEKPIEFTNLRIKSMELLNIQNGQHIIGEQLNSNYVLLKQDSENLREVKKGSLSKDSWEEIKVYESGYYTIFCYGKDTYSSIVTESLINVSIHKERDMVCDQWKAGEINITIKGNLATDNKLEMFVYSPKKISQTVFCFDWDIGFLSVSLNKEPNKCNYYSWLNYTEHYPPNATSKKDWYKWLPLGLYYCSSKEPLEQIAVCDSVDYTNCYAKYPLEIIPNRYKDKVLKCYSGGGSFFNDTRKYEIEIDKSDYLQIGDKIEIIIIDTDRRPEDFRTGQEYYSDSSGNDIGAQDLEIELKY